MESKTITCTVCPQGCTIRAELNDGEIAALSGYRCKRGETYARNELTDPRRTLTTTMRVCGGGLVSIKSAQPLPKDKLLPCMAVINAAQAQRPIKIGDVLIANILDTGVDIIATAHVI